MADKRRAGEVYGKNKKTGIENFPGEHICHFKKEIADYVLKEFGYDFSESLEHMRARHRMDESCMDALPKALRSFMDGTSFEDTVRNAVSLGGDTDTIAAIAGAMADAFFGISGSLLSECMMRVEDDMRNVLLWFDQVAKGKTNGKRVFLTYD